MESSKMAKDMGEGSKNFQMGKFSMVSSKMTHQMGEEFSITHKV